MVTQAGIGVVVGKIDTGMSVNDIDNDRDTMLVRDIDELLKVRASAKALVDAKITDREITPVNRHADVRQGHDLDGVDSEVAEIRHSVTRPIEVAAQLGYIHFIEDQIGKRRCLPIFLLRAPCIWLVTK